MYSFLRLITVIQSSINPLLNINVLTDSDSINYKVIVISVDEEEIKSCQWIITQTLIVLSFSD